MRTVVVVQIGAVCLLGACGSDGVSTREMQQAAIERARAEPGVPPGAPLEAVVWTGKKRDDELTYCGTISGERQADRVVPQRFVATGDPINFLVFENAHSRMVQTGEDKFVSWAALCEGQQAA